MFKVRPRCRSEIDTVDRNIIPPLPAACGTLHSLAFWLPSTATGLPSEIAFGKTLIENKNKHQWWYSSQAQPQANPPHKNKQSTLEHDQI